MTTTLYVNFTSELMDKAYEEVDKLTPAEREVAKQNIDKLYDGMVEIPLRNNPSLTLSGVSDDSGTFYDPIEFRVLSRYTVAGDVWLSGDGFRINFSLFRRTMLEMLNE